jgi:lipoprotein-anchoring transpeptidase ErfK/SrfK
VTRRVVLGLGCLLIAGAIGIVFVVTRDSGEKAVAPPATPPPPPTLERVEDLAVRVLPGRHVVLRARPEGRALATVAARTEFGSPQTLAVAFRKGNWLAVRSPRLGNRRVGWVQAAPLRLVRRPLQLDVDLSRRVLVVRDAHGIRRRISVAIGAPATPTPVGRFYVTDKLRGADFGSYYGCCILALSGRQPRLPQGWSGGDRLAIHGSPTPTWGHAVSNGCLHASEPDLRYLMKTVPLGTAVRIHA